MAENYYYYVDAVGEQSASPMTADAIATLVKSRVTTLIINHEYAFESIFRTLVGEIWLGAMVWMPGQPLSRYQNLRD